MTLEQWRKLRPTDRLRRAGIAHPWGPYCEVIVVGPTTRVRDRVKVRLADSWRTCVAAAPHMWEVVPC